MKVDKREASGTGPLGHIEEWESLALDYLEGRLASAEIERVEEHLEGCPDCGRKMQEQRAIMDGLWAIPTVLAPEHLQDHVFAALRVESTGSTAREASGPARTRRRSHAAAQPSFAARLRAFLQPRNIAVAATVLVFVVVGAVALSSNPALLRGPAPQTAENSRQADPLRTTTAAAEQVAGAAGDSNEFSEATSTTVSVGTVTTAATMSVSTTTATATTVTTTSSALPAIRHDLGWPEPKWVAVAQTGMTADQAAEAFVSATHLEPLPSEAWMGGPTFAVLASMPEIVGVLDYLKQLNFVLAEVDQPLDTYGNSVNYILAGYTSYPVLKVVNDGLSSDLTYGALQNDQPALLVFFVTQ